MAIRDAYDSIRKAQAVVDRYETRLRLIEDGTVFFFLDGPQHIDFSS